MKVSMLPLAAVLGLLLFGCSKTNNYNLEGFDVTAKKEMKIPTLGNLHFSLPEVPAYVETSAPTPKKVITVAPGANQLQSVINSAGRNATIRLTAGTHSENNIIVINRNVRLTGESGAVLSLGGFLGLVVSGADGTTIEGLEIVNAGTSLAALAVENASHVEIKGNAVSGFGFGILLEQADHARVMNNSIVCDGSGHGVTVINGDFVNVTGNEISNAFFGIWACDRKGTCQGNYIENSFLGIILCKVPAGSFPLGTGTGGSEFPGNTWQVTNNVANNNLWGYLVIDGAHGNTLSNNDGANNLVADMELAQETNNLFGLLTPTSRDNTVNVGGAGIEIIDCGINNIVHGGVALSGPCSD